MWSEFAGIIGVFKPAHPEAQALQAALGECKSAAAVSELLSKFAPDQRGHCDSKEFRAFHQLCRACLCEEESSLDWAAEDAARAIEAFRMGGSLFHEALARRVRAILYRKQHLESLAISELRAAIAVFRTWAAVDDQEGEYEKRSTLAAQLDLCGSQLEDAEAAIRKTSSPPSAGSGRRGRGTKRPAQIVYGIFDMVHAGLKGVFVMDDTQIGEMAIEEVYFDGRKHRLYNLREGRQIKAVPSGRYAWLRVAGASMNEARPVPIEPNDYILVDFNIKPQQGSLVFASLNDAPTPQERAGVIKRLGADGLISESSEAHDPIPLSRVTLKALVLAVAKPIDGQEA